MTSTYIKVFLITELIFSIIFIGLVSNFQVIINNSGKMPVYIPENLTNYSFDNLHFYYNNATNINNSFLADNHYFLNSIWSIGDFLLLFGMCCLLIFSIIISLKYIKEIKNAKRKIKRNTI